jgi:capsular exopolysaccharide synthesis family protein
MSKSFEESVGHRKLQSEETELPIEQWVDSLKYEWAEPSPRTDTLAGRATSAVREEIDGTALGWIELAARRPVRGSPFESSVFSQHSSAMPAIEAYRTLRTRLLRARALKGIQSVVITSSVPGEGKTFTANNLAVCHSHLQNTRVLLVDCDLRTAGLSAMLSERDAPGVADAMEGRCRFDDVVMATSAENLWFVPAGRSKIPAAELFARSRWKEFTEWTARHFTLSVIDTPPVTLVSDTELLISGCDGVLVVLQSRFAPREMVEHAANRVDKSKLLGVVLNSVKRSNGGSYAAYYGNSDRNETSKKKPF